MGGSKIRMLLEGFSGTKVSRVNIGSLQYTNEQFSIFWLFVPKKGTSMWKLRL